MGPDKRRKPYSIGHTGEHDQCETTHNHRIGVHNSLADWRKLPPLGWNTTKYLVNGMKHEHWLLHTVVCFIFFHRFSVFVNEMLHIWLTGSTHAAVLILSWSIRVLTQSLVLLCNSYILNMAAHAELGHSLEIYVSLLLRSLFHCFPLAQCFHYLWMKCGITLMDYCMGKGESVIIT